MNPYPDRIEELHAHLAAAYGQKDRQATEILLAALVQPPDSDSNALRPWLIIETDWPSRYTEYAWFAFGLGEGVVRSLSVPRALRSQPCEQVLSDWADRYSDGEIGLFVESDWRTVYKVHRGRGAGTDTHGWRQLTNLAHARLMARCLRIRVEHPRSEWTLWPASKRQAACDELRRLTMRVLDPDLRTRVPAVRTGLRPQEQAMLYWCELLQRVAPAQSDWETMVRSLAMIADRITHLYNDNDNGRDNDNDNGCGRGWRAAERVMRDCVPSVTRTIIENVVHATDVTYTRRTAGTRLRLPGGRITDRGTAAEMQRLRSGSAPVLVDKRARPAAGDPYVNHPARYRLSADDYGTLIDRSVVLLG